MSTDLQLGIATMFRDATQQAVIVELRTDADWERFKDIAADTERLTKAEDYRFETQRDDLLAAARKVIIDRAGAKNLAHPAPMGTDKFSKSEIERQAVAKVFNDHQAKLLGIKEAEATAYDELRDDIHAREEVRDHARDAFHRATDRRMGEDRRISGPTR